MRSITLFLLLVLQAVASAPFESSLTCKTCHPIIYNEFYGSTHRNASIFNDPIHKAIWDKHPLKKKQRYTCAVCHTPSDTKLMDALAANKPALPQENDLQTQEAITCIYCHKIARIDQHAKHNRNVLTTQAKTLFSARKSQKEEEHLSYHIESEFLGLVTTKSGSPFHDINFSNPIFYNGDICMGCHSHKQNSHHLNLCKIDSTVDNESNQSKENCISCHMPLVQGSFTTAHDSKVHRYHGFTGVSHQPEMLAKYVTIAFKQRVKGFDVIITNRANHALLLHPLRVGELRTIIERNGSTVTLKPVRFVRILGKNNKPTMPWIADSVLQDNQIKAHESRTIHFNTLLQEDDTVEVQLGHYRVNPKVASKLGLEKHTEATRFTPFKTVRFRVH